ncbi:MAG: hypothetical protein HYX21_02925 [Candidatus Yanofskybacteria bacterium]|nr:hypothetical protein [Candidatus Yanofskybacteria bacterium]
MENGYFYSRRENVNDLYYDAMELLHGNIEEARKAEKLLAKALGLDPNNIQTHIGFAHLYGRLKNKKKTEEHIKKAYEETTKKFPVWPKRMEWGDMDNRAYMRAIQYRADLYADDGEKEKAVSLYRLLLKLNPNDNQGARYTISGVYAGISGKEINKMFDECNRRQNWARLEDLIKKQNAKHKFWKEPRF